MAKARLPRARARSSSLSDQSRSVRSIWVTGINRSVCPATSSAPAVPLLRMDRNRSKRRSRAAWTNVPTRNVGLRNWTSMPRSSQNWSRAAGLK